MRSGSDNDMALQKEIEQSERLLRGAVLTGCGSMPSPHVREAIRLAASRRVQPQHMLFFRIGYAAAAMLLVTLTGWLVLTGLRTYTHNSRAQLLDDAISLCSGDSVSAVVPSDEKTDLPSRLLKLQGMDQIAIPIPEEVEESQEPISIDFQSGNRLALPAQKYG